MPVGGAGTVAFPGWVRFWNFPGLDHDVRVVLAVVEAREGQRAGQVTDEVALVRREGGPPVTVRALQRANLGQFIRQARATLSSELRAEPDGSLRYSRYGSYGGVGAGDEAILEARPLGRQRATKSAEKLGAVAAVYRGVLRGRTVGVERGRAAGGPGPGGLGRFG